MIHKLLVATLALLSAQVFADVAVVVHPSNANTLDNKTIERIFIGKAKSFPDGSQAVPINQEASSPATEEFNSKVLNRSASQLKAYWSKLLFTGKGQPPREEATDDAVKQLIAANPNLIGYIDAAADDTVKVIATF